MEKKRPIKVYVDGFRIDDVIFMPGQGKDLKKAAFTPKVRAALEGLRVVDISLLPSEARPRFIMITTELKNQMKH